MEYQIKYEFTRIKEEIINSNLLMIITHVKEIGLHPKTNEVKSIVSRYSTSEEYPLNEVPPEIQRLEKNYSVEISPREFDELIKLYKTDIREFLLYTPNTF